MGDTAVAYEYMEYDYCVLFWGKRHQIHMTERVDSFQKILKLIRV